MKKLLFAVILSISAISSAAFAEIKVGIILGFTGPIESLTPAMRDSAKLAFTEASNSGSLLGGETITVVEGDSTCVDADAATAAAELLVSEGVVAIMGADCSGVTKAIANNVGTPNGVPMVSPSATSPSLSGISDIFFRTAPSDARGGPVLADEAIKRGYTKLAVTYINNDYGRDLADAFIAQFTSSGGEITVSASHDADKADYSAEVAVLAAAGGEALVNLGYLNTGGNHIIQESLDTGAFDIFIMGDGMIGKSLVDEIGSENFAGSFALKAGNDSDGANRFKTIASQNGLDGSAPYANESYDAAALIVLAMQAGESSDKTSIKDNIKSVANAPGMIILPGQIRKGIVFLKNGDAINYEGASMVELGENNDPAGAYAIYEVKGDDFAVVEYLE